MVNGSTPALCPGTGPCGPWTLSLACLDDTGDLADACVDGRPIPPGVLDGAVLSASQVLWALTGRQFSTCDVTLRPCRRGHGRSFADSAAFAEWFGWSGPWPVLIDGQWFNWACGCTGACSCQNLCEVDLPYPVCEVSGVTIDGVELDPSAWRVDDFRRLVRIDGSCWPHQDMSLELGDAGTWSVDVTYGKAPPQLALDAAAELACEFLKARLGQTCRLPQRIVSLTRQGVTMSFIDPQTFLTEGRTGLYLTDLAVRTFNPKMLARPPAVYSPDVSGWRVPTS
jgi:hypothetical protein